MYQVVQLYSYDNEICSHMVAFRETFNEAYEVLSEVYNECPESFVLTLGLEKEDIKNIALKQPKEKSLLTIWDFHVLLNSTRGANQIG